MSEARLQRLEEKMNKMLDRTKDMKDINHNMQVLNDSFKAFNEDFEDFREKFDSAMKENVNLRKTVSSLEADNVFLKKEVKFLRNALEEGYHSAKATEMEIVGFPPKPAENLKEMLLKVADKISVTVAATDLKYVKRVEGKREKSGIIKVKFSDESLCAEFLMKARKAKLKGKDLGCVGAQNPIYFNECLSDFSRMLLYNARSFRRDEGWKYVWVKDGKIFLRKADKEPVIRISSLDDIAMLKK